MKKITCLIFLFCSILSVHAERNNVALSLLPVPIVRQANTYSCGAASLLSLLYYWDLYELGETSLYKELGTTEQGTDPEKIVEVAHSHGLKAELKINTPLQLVFEAVDRKEPVIVGFQAWAREDETDVNYENIWDSGHFAIVIGYDAEKVYFMDPSSGPNYGFLTQKDFLTRWHDEDKIGGHLVKHNHLAIFIKGEKAISTFPAPMEVIQ